MEKKFSLKNSLSFKLLIIGILIGVLMIPTGMIFSLVSERQNRQEEAFREISEKWGGIQTISGLILTVPYKKAAETIVDGEKKIVATIGYAHFLPETLNIEGQVTPEIRRRGIYEVALYRAELKLSGEFSFPSFSQWDIPVEQIMYNKAFVSLGIPDLRGVTEGIDLSWNDKDLSFKPGIETHEVLVSGVSVSVPLNTADQEKKYVFSTLVKVNGSRDLFFTPVGRETKVKLTSNWPSPSFQGAFLPKSSTVDDNGFNAEWNIVELNRNFPQKILGSLNNVKTNVPPPVLINPEGRKNSISGFGESDFGVELLIPADQYQKTARTLKYAVMILALTFLVLFFFEAHRKKNVHPLQYILIGLALSLFYVLLLALAEQLGFDWAYFLSATAIITLITLYSKSVFTSWRPALLESLILVFVYGFIYVILQLEDFSLLVGAIGLFVILAMVMLASRKIDWQEINS